MNHVLERIHQKAITLKKTIVLPESSEPRTLRAVEKVLNQNLARIILIGDSVEIHQKAKHLGVNIDGANIIDPDNFPLLETYSEILFEARKDKDIKSIDKAKNILKKDSIYFATLMVFNGEADGMVTGAIHTTADTLRPALQIIKTAEGISTVSSCFLIITNQTSLGENGVFIFADCAINPEPAAEELASIAVSTASTAKSLLDIEPRIAMLSFSTKGSAKHPLVDKVIKATEILKTKHPDILVDGELQLDAAIIKEVAELKAPDSPVAGKANILIFPDLQAGNIGYKLVQRLGNAEAIGPISQGLKKPINDLSRGCSVDDIINLIAITAVQSIQKL
ncbi:MAG: phosphate acetyltransferase [Ignavibacteria bacterium]